MVRSRRRSWRFLSLRKGKESDQRKRSGRRSRRKKNSVSIPAEKDRLEKGKREKNYAKRRKAFLLPNRGDRAKEKREYKDKTLQEVVE